MAGNSAPTTSSQQALYFLSGTDRITVAPTAANVAAKAVAANEIVDCVEPDAIAENANPISYTPLNSKVQKQLAGAAALGEFGFSVVIDDTDSKHKELRDVAIGEACQVIVAFGSGANITFEFLTGTKGGRSRTLGEGTGRYRFTMLLDEAPQTFDKA